jgi:uncharacterized delta-60 repeat protein
MKFYSTLFTLLWVISHGYSQTAGTIDVSFGNNGYYNTEKNIFSMVETSNKDLLFLESGLVGLDISIGRLKATNYSLDSSFADNGYIRSNGGFIPRWFGVIPDGRIIVVFYSSNFSTEGITIKTARYSPEGGQDMGFGIDGFSNSVTIPKGTIFDLLVHPNGSVFATGGRGSIDLSIDGKIFLVHIDQNGQATYPGTGFLNIDLSATGYDTGIARSLALQPDGKVIIGGYISPAMVLTQRVMYMKRFDENGQPDNSFGITGYVTDNDGEWSGIQDIVVDPNGKIYVTAYRGYDDNIVIRYNADGSRDNTFGTQGILAQIGVRGKQILLQPDGKILVSGNSDNFTSPDPLIFRIKTNGTKDNSFSGDSYFVQPYNASIQNFMGDMTLLSSGKLLFGIYSGLYNTTTLSRLHTGLVVAAEEPFAASIKVAVLHPNVFRERAPLRVSYSPNKDIDPVVSANGTTSTTSIKLSSGGYLEADMPAQLSPGIYQLMFMDGSEAVRAQFVKVD